MDEDFLKEVFRKLTNSPTSDDTGFLLEAYTKIGHLLAEAKSAADDADAVRRKAEAEEYLRAKQSGETAKVTDSMAEKMAQIATFDLRRKQTEAERKALKLRHLRESVYQALSTVRSGTITFGEEA